MKAWLLWMVLARLTGSPIGSAVALLCVGLVLDRFTWGLVPSPFRWLARFNHRKNLERTLLNNPHDGRARLELAQLEVERDNGKQAVELLRPTFDTGADDIQSVFTMGQACLQSGYVEQGEKLLAHAEELDPDFRMGEVFLIRGRHRLTRGELAKAVTDLETFVRLRTGTVEGRVLLAQAKEKLGDDVNAVILKDAAWSEYVQAPRFRRRQERQWAWRARPSRLVLLVVCLSAAVLAFSVLVAPKLNTWASDRSAAEMSDLDDE